jgi:hypothetical protein
MIDQHDAPTPASSTREAGMVFLGGVGSGGTDLLMNIMNAHGEMFVPGEIPFLPAIADKFAARVPAGDVAAAAAEMRRLDEYNTLGHHHWQNWVSDRKDEIDVGPPPAPVDGHVTLARIYQWLLGVPEHITWTGNKTPTNTENIDRLARAFPDARFVLIVRDPRDVALSWRSRWNRDERMTADKWDRRLAAGRRHLAALPGDRALVVRYEQVLDDLETVCRDICAFLDLPFDPEMLRFHEHVTKTIDGQENRGRPLKAGNYGKWRTKLAPKLVRRVEEIAWDGLHAYGYEVTAATGKRPLTRAERLLGRATDVRAVLLGTNRHQHINPRKQRIKRIVLQTKRYILRRDITT